ENLSFERIEDPTGGSNGEHQPCIRRDPCVPARFHGGFSPDERLDHRVSRVSAATRPSSNSRHKSTKSIQDTTCAAEGKWAACTCAASRPAKRPVTLLSNDSTAAMLTPMTVPLPPRRGKSLYFL